MAIFYLLFLFVYFFEIYKIVSNCVFHVMLTPENGLAKRFSDISKRPTNCRANRNKRKPGLFRIRTTILDCSQYTIHSAVFVVLLFSCCTFLCQNFLSPERREMQFCNSLTDIPTNVKNCQEHETSKWTQIGQFGRCGRNAWCASADYTKFFISYIYESSKFRGI